MIPFLGRMAWASKAPVVLSRKTGVAVLPSFIHRENGHHVITFYPECVFGDGNGDGEITRDIEIYSQHIDRFIIAHPTDWYWVHRRWKRAGAAA
jgi:KDO2-lipid IV(A) lauroyltransferase